MTAQFLSSSDLNHFSVKVASRIESPIANDDTL